MKRFRLFFYIILNVFVTVITMIVVMYFFNNATYDNFSISMPNFSLADAVKGLRSIQPPGDEEPATSNDVKVVMYRVTAGDTAQNIASSHAITVDELLRFNGLTEEVEILSGMVLRIPEWKQDIQPTMETSTATEQIGSVEYVTEGLEIVGVFGAGDVLSERVMLESTGENTIDLSGYKLQDKEGFEFEFPKLTLYAGGAVNVYSTTGTNSVVDLYWGQVEAIWQSGETVMLLNPSGYLMASYKIP